MNKGVIGFLIIFFYIKFLDSGDTNQFLGLIAIVAGVVAIIFIEKKRKLESLEVSEVNHQTDSPVMSSSEIPIEHEADVDQKLDKPTYMRQQKMMKLYPAPEDHNSDIDKMLDEPTYKRISSLFYQIFKSKPIRFNHDDEQINASNNIDFNKQNKALIDNNESNIALQQEQKLNKAKEETSVEEPAVSKSKVTVQNEDKQWMETLILWAYENNIPSDKLTRDRAKLPTTTALNLPSINLTHIPKEIGNLTELRWLGLQDNRLKELPDDICKLINLKSLGLNDNPNLFLTSLQKQWIDKIRKNGCHVKIDDLNYNA